MREKIGRYLIKSELGRGGMATVYHAYDPQFEREVAIKVLPLEFLEDHTLRERFHREARTLASLEQSAIVPVYDLGEEGSQPYIVMRFMSGGSLADRIKNGPIPARDVSKYIQRLGAALDVAHARGIIHRDLKPANILFDQFGEPFISDFGIAHIAQEGLQTLTGASIIGTPAYMSPEQVQADKTVDSRSDLYALGIITYEMLTGKMPFQAETPAKVMMMHILQAPPRVSRELSEFPPELDNVIEKVLAKSPDQRYATGADFARAFQITTERFLGEYTVQLKQLAESHLKQMEFDQAIARLTQANSYALSAEIASMLKEYQRKKETWERLREYEAESKRLDELISRIRQQEPWIPGSRPVVQQNLQAVSATETFPPLQVPGLPRWLTISTLAADIFSLLGIVICMTVALTLLEYTVGTVVTIVCLMVISTIAFTRRLWEKNIWGITGAGIFVAIAAAGSLWFGYRELIDFYYSIALLPVILLGMFGFLQVGLAVLQKLLRK